MKGISLKENSIFIVISGIWLIATCFSVLSMGEVLRTLRFVNMILGIYLIISSFILIQGQWSITLIEILFGSAFILLAIPKGKIQENYGTWNRWIF